MNNMTDNEIIKALECCWNENECIGDECPFFKPINDCAPLIAMETLDLINRQKAEIKRLHTSIKEVDEYLSNGDFANGISLIIRLVKSINN
jgi:hypothetical protein